MFIGPPQTYSATAASRLGLVVPMKKILHSCKYSTGANRTRLSEVQLQLPVKEGTPNYNILFVRHWRYLSTPASILLYAAEGPGKPGLKWKMPCSAPKMQPTDLPARWTYSRKCAQDQMFTLLCLQIEEHFGPPQKTYNKSSLRQAVFLYHSKGHEGTGLDEFHKLLEASKPKNVRKN